MHTRGEIITFLEKMFGHGKPSNQGLNVAFLCPKCHEESGETVKKKLVIRTDNFWVHCWVCSYKKRSIIGLIKKYHPQQLQEFLTEFGDMLPSFDDEPVKSFQTTFNDMLEKEDNQHKEVEPIRLPKGFVLLADVYGKNQRQSPQVQQALSYLRFRNVSINDMWFYKFGIATQDSEYADRIIIPSHGANGDLNFFTSRAIKKGVKPKYYGPKFPRETVVFNEINIDWKKELMLVEGPFDLAKCAENTVPLLGSDLTKDYLVFQRIIENETPVLLALDNDARSKTFKILKLLFEYGVQVRLLEVPAPHNDIGELTKEKVEQLCSQAPTITTRDLFSYRLNLTT